MSKSTPLSNLPNLKKQSGQAFEQRENEIVKEILNEIDNDGGSNAPSPEPEPELSGPSPEEIQRMKHHQAQQAMMEQQMMEQQMMEQQMREQMLQQQNQEALSKQKMNDIVAKEEGEPKSFVDQLLETAKPSILVAVIVAVMSLPFVANMISKVISSKEALKKFEMPLTLLVKGVLGGVLFYGGSTAIEL
jgi:hypothetical protein